jgi:hypothetical protein
MTTSEPTTEKTIRTLKTENEVFDAIFNAVQKPVPEAAFKIADGSTFVTTSVGEYLVERSVFDVGMNVRGKKCLIVDIEDGLSEEPKLYIDFETLKGLIGISRVRGKDALRFADRNYAAFEKIVADLNNAVVDDVKGTVPYVKSNDVYDGSPRERAYIYELACLHERAWT